MMYNDSSKFGLWRTIFYKKVNKDVSVSNLTLVSIDSSSSIYKNNKLESRKMFILQYFCIKYIF